MKAVAIPLGSLLILAASSAGADAVSDAAAAGAVGAMAGVAFATAGTRDAPPAPAFVGSELDDWIDPATGATSRFADACGHAVELRLSRGFGRNILNVTLSNHSPAPSSFDGHGVVATFESGLTRRLEPLGESDAWVRPGWWTFRAMGFPAKEDFRHKNRIVVELPLRDEKGSVCTIKVDLKRSPDVAPDPRTYVPHTIGEVFLEIGPHVAAGGGQKSLGAGRGGELAVGFVAWPSVNHGIFFDVVIESYGKRGVYAALPGQTFDNPRLSGSGMFLGYTFRLYAARWLSASYGVGIGGTVLEVNDDAQRGTSYLTTVLAPVRERLSLTFAFPRLPDGTQFALAPSVVHTFVPFGSYGASDATGHSLAVLLRLVLGE